MRALFLLVPLLVIPGLGLAQTDRQAEPSAEAVAECLSLEREIDSLARAAQELDTSRQSAMAEASEARLQRRTLADTARVDPAASLAVRDLDYAIETALAEVEGASQALYSLKTRREAKTAAFNATCAGLRYSERTYRRALRLLRRDLRGN